MRQPLPVDPLLPQLCEAVAARGAAVLRAPTGAGKTTRVPPALLDAGLAGDRAVVVLEPRRVAARAAASRIARERGAKLGREVGYHVRFDRRASDATRLLVVTEGVFLRMLQDDPLLERVGAVVFDEFHERSLQADVALAMVQRVREARDDLRVVVMSATLDTGPLAAYLGDCPVLESEGRGHPVEILQAPPARDERLERSVLRAVADVLERSDGDVLVFLPGVGEIRRAAKELGELSRARGFGVLELHGELSPERQDAVLRPAEARRVILSTNVAETSLTIEGVTAVVDSGLERLPRVDPGVGLERLERVRISRESAEQRAGRAGRTAPGVCVRLWSASEERRMAARREPAIRRADLATTVLELHAWGESDLGAFPWYEAPEPGALARAESLLERLGALAEGRITETGRRMARVPAHPRVARLLDEARSVGHAPRLALAAAVLSERDLFARSGSRETTHHSPSDVLDRIEALEEFERKGRSAGFRTVRRGRARFVLRARDQLLRSIPKTRDPRGRAEEAVLRALLAAYPDRVARRRAAGAPNGVMVGGRGVRLAAESAVRDPELFVCVDVDAGRRDERAESLVRLASAVDRDWLPAERVRTEEAIRFDTERQSVVATRRTLYDDLVLDDVAVKLPRGEAVEKALAEAAAGDLQAALDLDDGPVASFLARLRSLASWMPELALPTFDDDALRALLPELCTGRRSFAELRRAPLLGSLKGRLTHPQRRSLEQYAPERLQVPSGSRVALQYEAGRPPVLAVRIQEVFGLRETPRVAGGRVPVLLHLLAPNGRPQQVTDDLPSFWANTYSVVRKELRRRYPKHAWPEDPLTAAPEKRPRRRRR